MIWFKLWHDQKTGRDFRAVYLDGKQVGAFWTLAAAIRYAEQLAAKTGATIYSAPIIPLAKMGAA